MFIVHKFRCCFFFFVWRKAQMDSTTTKKATMQTKKNTSSNKHSKNCLFCGEDGSLAIISRVHPKGKRGHTNEGITTCVQVLRQELEKDLKVGMPLCYLIPKYWLSQKGAKGKKRTVCVDFLFFTIILSLPPFLLHLHSKKKTQRCHQTSA